MEHDILIHWGSECTLYNCTLETHFKVLTSPSVNSCSHKLFTRIGQKKSHEASNPCLGGLIHSVTDSDKVFINHFRIKFFFIEFTVLVNRVYLWIMWNKKFSVILYHTCICLNLFIIIFCCCCCCCLFCKWVWLLHITFWEEFIHLNEIYVQNRVFASIPGFSRERHDNHQTTFPFNATDLTYKPNSPSRKERLFTIVEA